MTLFLRLPASGTSKIHLLFSRLVGSIDGQLYYLSLTYYNLVIWNDIFEFHNLYGSAIPAYFFPSRTIQRREPAIRYGDPLRRPEPLVPSRRDGVAAFHSLHEWQAIL